jgi:hypothetical protein
MSERTPSQQAYLEQQETIAKIVESGASLTSESNKPTVNNVEGHDTDSQGIEGSLERRAVPDASFNQNVMDAYESYAENDPYAGREAAKRAGVVRYDPGP